MRYFKLGAKAEMFYDPITKIKITKGIIAAISEKQVMGSKVLQKAIAGGHLESTSEMEYLNKQIAEGKKLIPKKEEANEEANEEQPLNNGGLTEEEAAEILDQIKEKTLEEIPEYLLTLGLPKAEIDTIMQLGSRKKVVKFLEEKFKA